MGKRPRTHCPPELKQTFTYMIMELEGNRLKTVLVPAKFKNCAKASIRMNESENPEWYQDLCGRHMGRPGNPRYRSSTYIDRRWILRALNTLVNRGYTHSRFAQDLIEIAHGQKAKWDDWQESSELPQ